mgnify:FL=1
MIEPKDILEARERKFVELYVLEKEKIIVGERYGSCRYNDSTKWIPKINCAVDNILFFRKGELVYTTNSNEESVELVRVDIAFKNPPEKYYSKDANDIKFDNLFTNCSS